VTIYEFGRKRTYYTDPKEKAIKTKRGFAIKKELSNGFPVLYASPYKKDRFIATNRLIVRLSSKEKIKQIEQRYNLKFIKPINERVGLYLFEAPKDADFFSLSNRINLSGIKAKIDYYAPYKLY
jgi:hypothetical protein